MKKFLKKYGFTLSMLGVLSLVPLVFGTIYYFHYQYKHAPRIPYCLQITLLNGNVEYRTYQLVPNSYFYIYTHYGSYQLRSSSPDYDQAENLRAGAIQYKQVTCN